jgi:ribosome biogenesis GTPase
MQAFGLHHLNCEELAWGFIEFRPYIGQCKFNNCRHGHEPGCALAQATREGKINPRRFAFYQKLAIPSSQSWLP